jgi:ABC-type nitrate/sulfonate/bicarbonate transport system permease component
LVYKNFLLDIFVSLRRLAFGYFLAATIAWIPIAMFLFGVGDGLAIYIISYGASFQFILNTTAGVKSIDRNLIEVSLTLGTKRWMIIKEVILPGTLPLIIVASRLAMASAWMSIVAAELVGAPDGLGFRSEYREYIKQIWELIKTEAYRATLEISGEER